MPDENQCIVCGKQSTTKYQIRQTQPTTELKFRTIGSCDEHEHLFTGSDKESLQSA